MKTINKTLNTFQKQLRIIKDFVNEYEKIDSLSRESLEPIIKSMIEKIGDKEEMSEEKEEVELSAEVSEPIKHNPEKEDKKFNFKISNKEETTMDRIYNRLNNN